MRFYWIMFQVVTIFALMLVTSNGFVLMNEDKVENEDLVNGVNNLLREQKPLYFNVEFPQDDKIFDSSSDRENLFGKTQISFDDPEASLGGFGKQANIFESEKELNDPNDVSSQREEALRTKPWTQKKRRSPSRQYPTQFRPGGLADPGLDGLGLSSAQDTWNPAVPRKNGIYMPPVSRTDAGSDDREGKDFYTYTFVGENFKLNGSASITFNGLDKFRVTFKFSITGDGNATADLVTQEQEVKFPTMQDGTEINSAFSRPESCHLQTSENKTKITKRCKRPVQLPKGASAKTNFGRSSRWGSRSLLGSEQRYPFFDDNYSFMTSSLISPNGPSLSESFIFPRNQPSPKFDTSDNKNDANCDVTTTNYVRKWLCIGQASPPCFMMIVQGQKYKVAKKFCPQRIYSKGLL